MPKPFRAACAAYAAKPLRVAPAMQEGKMTKLRTVLEIVVASASESLVFGKEVWVNPLRLLIFSLLDSATLLKKG